MDQQSHVRNRGRLILIAIRPEDGAINHDHYIYGCPKKWMKRKGQWVETPPLPDDYY